LYVLLETIRYSLILYQPLIPDSASSMLDQINIPKSERSFIHLDSCPLKPKEKLASPKIILSRFEVPGNDASNKIEGSKKQQEQKEKLDSASKKPKAASPSNTSPEIDISRLEIRVGVITRAWKHDEADKLYCEEIDIGEESPRRIASGLREHYNDASDLEGRRVLVLSNLKSRKLVGFASHGMVLCASKDEKVEFVEPPEDAVIGERIFVEGFPGEPSTENQVGKKKMLDKIFPELKTDKDGVATYKGSPLMTSAGVCKTLTEMSGAKVS